jgi:exosortase K
MQFRRETWHWQTLTWWLVVLAVVVLLKHHYSVATTADLDWMFRPLSKLLEWFSGHSFHRNSNYEWVSESADVRLVKACAGINFMLMSFMAHTWILRPNRRVDGELWSWVAGRTALICAALVAALATCLLANSLRIIVAMTVNSNGAELHRLIGMLIYVPLLSLQLSLSSRSDNRDALAGPALVYLLLMVLVPLLTGNALQNPALFVEHLLYVSMLIAVMCALYYLTQRLKRRRVIK